MKKLLLIIAVIALLTSCGTYSSVDSMSQLRSGMNKMEVEYYLGTPIDVVTVNYTQNGVQEVLAYRNNYDEVYAVEFWNNYLTGYEYLYDDRPYIAPSYPMMMPPAGRPIIVVPGRDRPNRPNRPSKPSRPARPDYNNNDRPSNNNRPSNNGRPSNNNNRPTNNNRPSNNNNNNNRPTNNERPSNNNNRPTNNSRPNNNSDKPANGRTSNGRYGDRTSTTNNDKSTNTSTNNSRNTNNGSSRSSSSSSTRSTETKRTTDNSSKTSGSDRSSSTRTSKRTTDDSQSK